MQIVQFIGRSFNKNAKKGEILLILVRRSGLEGKEIASKLGIDPATLSRLYKKEKLSKSIIDAASEVFGVDKSIFETGIGYDVPDKTLNAEEPDEEYLALEAEVERLHDEIRKLSAEVAREKGINEDLRKLLLKISGAG